MQLKKINIVTLIAACLTVYSCGSTAEAEGNENEFTAEQEPEQEVYVPIQITIEKELQFDNYTLADTFPYKDTVRYFQWDKVREKLRVIDSIQMERITWGVLQNKSNANGEGALVKEWHRNEFNRVTDRNGVERHQSIPLYAMSDSETPEVYGRDGSLVRIIHADTTDRMTVETINFEGRWTVQSKYVKNISDTVTFHRVAIVDRTMQTIMTVERVGDTWYVRSMNPATTGLNRPPYQHATPLGIFAVIEKKPKMFYTHDGNSTIAGYAPWASRFSQGGYIHGVPTNDPNGSIIEYSYSLGTTPRSHMCVRNATSHAKFVYDWAKVYNSLVAVIE